MSITEKPRLDPAIADHVGALNSDSGEPDRTNSVRALLELVRYGSNALHIIDSGGIPALVKQLQPPVLSRGSNFTLQSVTLKLLQLVALHVPNDETFSVMINEGGLPAALIKLLITNKLSQKSNDIIAHALMAISVLSEDRVMIKKEFRLEGGIPPIVRLMQFKDAKVKLAAMKTLGVLALGSQENKKEMLNSGAVIVLVRMLKSDNTEIQYESIRLLGIIFKPYGDVDKTFLALIMNSIISMLSSSCEEICAEALDIIKECVNGDDYRSYPFNINNAIGALIWLLQSASNDIRKTSVFILSRLSQDPSSLEYFSEGITALLDLLVEDLQELQLNAAIILYRAALKEFVGVEMIRKGAIERLLRAKFNNKIIQGYADGILQKIKENLSDEAIERLRRHVSSGEVDEKRHILVGIYQIGSPAHIKEVFSSCQGHDLVMELLSMLNAQEEKQKKCACMALSQIARKSAVVNPGPTKKSSELFEKNIEVSGRPKSDVIFVVTGQRFKAAKKTLAAKSDVFKAMFDAGFKENFCEEVMIKNISPDVFELLLRFSETGSVDINLELAPDLYEAADQYNIEELKVQCAETMSKDLKLQNLRILYDFSAFYDIVIVKETCIRFVLQNYEEMQSSYWFQKLFDEILPDLKSFFERKF